MFPRNDGALRPAVFSDAPGFRFAFRRAAHPEGPLMRRIIRLDGGTVLFNIEQLIIHQ
jgi:hypothetical protein